MKRLDFGRLDGAQRTPQGGLRVPAALTRVGILPYSDGSRSWKEFRPPAEVFNTDSLQTLCGATVVDQHPKAGAVTPANFKALSVGHVHDDVRADGNLVVGTLTVNDAGEVAMVEAGDRVEVSCGYECDVDPTPGEYQGERYDGVQRNIRYNHVGLGPEGWGRAGPEVSLRLDGAAVEVRSAAAAAARNDGTTMKRLKVKGSEFRLDSDEEVDKAQGAVDEMQKKADAESNELAGVKAALMDALQKVAALEAKQAAASAATPPAVTEEQVPEAVADSLVTKRLQLRERAQRVLGAEAKLDGKGAREIHREVIAKALPSVKLDGLTDETVRGMFEAITEQATQRNDALGEAHRSAVGQAGSTGASANDDPAAAMRNRTAARASQPTAITASKGA